MGLAVPHRMYKMRTDLSLEPGKHNFLSSVHLEEASEDSDNEFWNKVAIEALEELGKSSGKQQVRQEASMEDDFWGKSVVIDALEQAERCSVKQAAGEDFEHWKRFRKANDALEFAKSFETAMCPITMAQEMPGQKSGFQYIVSTLDKFVGTYMKIEGSKICYYELIRPEQKCHLYFDLEFDPRHNQGKDGNLMIETLLSIVGVLVSSEFPGVHGL
ncbi:hypothetical protein CBR_g47978 [Chara braunii]|uniref:DNA-directed primase/polymerase protein n=1 Tax=Chara braunii TaxID=69332 RepID=A0A388M1Q0_CHABU|nr:hypothetical protein CBR_g47978 [Chara braunii]|eukprot:GBG88507.1 hypothetical protein CBR_g47978 [Chara braunii]